MQITTALLVTLSVTFYLPDAGGINDDLFLANGTRANIEYAACGPDYSFGTVFEIGFDMTPYGRPQVFECHDRGSGVGYFNLDLVMRTGDLKQDWAYARAWGKRRVPVHVYANWGDYIAAQQKAQDAAIAAEQVENQHQLARTAIP